MSSTARHPRGDDHTVSSFAVDDWTRLERFLRLGSEEGFYRVPLPALNRDEAGAVVRCLQSDGPRAVGRILAVAESGRAPRDEPAVFALALAAAEGDDETRRLALAALPDVCRTGALLFRFARYVGSMRGWGRGLRDAIGRWYAAMPEDELARQMVRHPRTDDWSHRDLLRLAHPRPDTDARRILYHWATQGWPGVGKEPHDLVQLRPVWAFEKVRYAHHPGEVAALVREYGLPREAVPTYWLSQRVVWEALLSQMSLPELLESLPALTRAGVLADPEIREAVAQTVADPRRLAAAHLHPIAILAAREAYARGHDGLPSLRNRQQQPQTWEPVPAMLATLDRAFDIACGLVTPTGRRCLIALDVSGSMASSVVPGLLGLSTRVVAAALALIMARTEPKGCRIAAFTPPIQGEGHGGRYGGGRSRLAPLVVPPGEDTHLADVLTEMDRVPFGGADCALPMEWALETGVAVDAFFVLTDSETWYGAYSPADALHAYRSRSAIDARLAVVGMTSPGFSIAAPDDAGMLDIIGFDAATPWLLSDFAAGTAF